MRNWLFGRDEDLYFDVRVYQRFTMRERTMRERFIYRALMPICRLHFWMSDWDGKFQMRYFDIRKAQYPERYIQ